MTANLTKAFGNLQRNIERMNSLSVPLMFAGGFGAKAVYDFEKIGNAVQAVTDLTDEQRKSLEDYAKQLNALFPYNNAEIMKAAFELARAGLNTDQVIGALKETLNLGLAGDIELQRAADIATNAIMAFGLKMGTTEEVAASLRRVVDNLAYAANKSNTDVSLMGDTFKYVAPMARAAGLAIEDVSAAAMIMANNGIKGAEAGVALRSALVRMVRPTKPMMAALAGLNLDLGEFVKKARDVTASDVVSFLNVEGIDAKPMSKAIQKLLDDKELQAAPDQLLQRIVDVVTDGLGSDSAVDRSKLSEAVSEALTVAGSQVDLKGFIKALQDRGATLGDIAKIFDQRQGARLMTLLFGDMFAAADDVVKNATGSANKMSETRQKGIVGAWARLTASWENLFVTIGKSGVAEAAAQMFDNMAAAIDRLAAVSPEALKFGTYALGALMVLGPLGLVLRGVVGFFGSIAAACQLIAAGAGGVVAVFRAAMGLAGATAAGAAATAAGGASAAGGAAAAADAASKGGGFLSKALKFGGWLYAGYEAASYLKDGTEAAIARQAETNARVDKLAEAVKRSRTEPVKPGAYYGKDFTFGAFGGFRTPDKAPAASDTFVNAPTAMKRSEASMKALPAAMEKVGLEGGKSMVDGLDAAFDDILKKGLLTAQRLREAFSFMARPNVVMPSVAGGVRGVQADTGLGTE